MKTPLSLPVERNAKLAPKHQSHGTPLVALIDSHIRVSLGVPEPKQARHA